MKWILLLAFGLVGIALSVGGTFWAYSRYQLWTHGVSVTGKVVEHHKSVTKSTVQGRDHYTNSFYPVVAFQLPTGEEIRFQGSTGGSEPTHPIGAVVPVLFHPSDPKNAQIKAFEQFWLGPILMPVFGLAFLIASIFSFFAFRPREQAFNQPFFGLARVNRTQSVQARILSIESTSGQDEAATVGLILESIEPVSGQYPRFSLAPTLLRLKGRLLTPEDLEPLVGTEISVKVDPDDPSDFQIDYRELEKRTQALRKTR